MSTEPEPTLPTLANPQATANPEDIARTVAEICVRAYDDHIHAHGPDSSEVMREAGSQSYLVRQSILGSSVAFIKRNGIWLAIHIYPIEGSPLMTYEPRPEGYRYSG